MCRRRTQGGKHYQVKTNNRVWVNEAVFNYKVRLPNFQFDKFGELANRRIDGRLKLSFVPRGKSPTSSNHLAKVLLITFGEREPPGAYCEWGKKQVEIPDLSKSLPLFNVPQSKLFYYGGKRSEYLCLRNELAPSAEKNSETDGISRASGKYTFVVESGETFIVEQVRQNGAMESVEIRLSNFEIRNVKCEYYFEGAEPRIAVLSVRVANKYHDAEKYPDSERVGASCLDDSEKKTNFDPIVRWVDVDVEYTLDSLTQDHLVSLLFHQAHPFLDCTFGDRARLKFEELYRSAKQNSDPPLTRAVAAFGRQKGDGAIVVSNVAIVQGTFVTLERAKYAVVPRFFEGKSFPRDCFPRCVVIPFSQVRYFIGHKIWCDLMPRVFLNNTAGARAVLAAAVMQVHASKLWAGEAGARGTPIVWISSKEHNTGKSRAQQLVYAVLGFKDRALTQASVTPARLSQALDRQCDLPLCLEDAVIPTSKKEVAAFEDRWSDIGRRIYDGSSREVHSKIETPKSAIIVSANGVTCESDHAFQSRVLTVPFDVLDTGGPRPPTDWDDAMHLASALLVDFSNMLVDGKLHKDAICDCVSFVSQLDERGAARERSCANWGLLLYFWLNMNRMLGNGDVAEAQREAIAFVAQNAVTTLRERASNTPLVHEFLLAIENVRPGTQAFSLGGPQNSTISWHNYRSNLTLPASAPGSYIAVRIEAACAALNNMPQYRNRFKREDLVRGLKKFEWVKEGKGAFYCTDIGGWPIQKMEHSEESATHERLLLQESEISPEHLKEETCHYFCKKRVNAIVRDASATTTDAPPLEHIDVESSNAAWGTYNFVEAVVDGRPNQSDPEGGVVEPWFGFQVARDGAFGAYCGVRDRLDFETPLPRAEDMNRERGFGLVRNVFNLHFLARTFSYEHFPTIDDVPPAIQNVAFVTSRVEPNDAIHPNPLEEASSPPEQPSPSSGIFEDSHGKKNAAILGDRAPLAPLPNGPHAQRVVLCGTSPSLSTSSAAAARSSPNQVLLGKRKGAPESLRETRDDGGGA